MLDKFLYHKIRELSQSVCLCTFSFLTFYCVYERETVGVRETGRQREKVSKFTPWHICKSQRTTHRSSLLLPWGPGFEHRVSGLLTSAFTHWALWLTQKCSNSPPFQAILLPVSWWNRQPLICSWSNTFITK